MLVGQLPLTFSCAAAPQAFSVSILATGGGVADRLDRRADYGLRRERASSWPTRRRTLGMVRLAACRSRREERARRVRCALQRAAHRGARAAGGCATCVWVLGTHTPASCEWSSSLISWRCCALLWSVVGRMLGSLCACLSSDCSALRRCTDRG